MTDSPPDPALHLAAQALAIVLDLEADDLRADSPLDDLGADAIARVQWADVAEASALDQGSVLAVDDQVLRSATTLGDLADHVRSQGITS